MLSRVFKLVVLIAASWCVMTFTHEIGHILGAWSSGGTLTEAELRPWHLPYSFFDPDPHPLLTLWCGPLFGVLAPLTAALLVRRDWVWFIAYFCLLANGLYIAAGWMSDDRQLDTPKLIAHGASSTTIVVYCVVTIGFGYAGFRKAMIGVLSKSN